MGKLRLAKGAGKRTRSSSEEEERGPVQKNIKSYFGKESCQLWSTFGQETKRPGNRKSLKLSTKKDSKCNETSSPLDSKSKGNIESSFSMGDKPHISLQNVQNITELEEFTKILEQNSKFKKPVLTPKNTLLQQTNKSESSFRKCIAGTSDQRSSGINDLSISPLVLDDGDDDDLIPPTPSPARQQSFVTCVDHRSSLSTKLPQSHSSSGVLMADTLCNSSTLAGKLKETNSLATYTPSIIANEQASNNLQTCNDKTTTKEQHSSKISCQDIKDQKEETTENTFLNKSAANNNYYKDLNIEFYNFEESSPMLTTSRKKYKVSRKKKPPKLLASPLKKLDNNCQTKSFLRNKLPLKKVVEQPNQRESSCDNTLSKCDALRSRMKRPPTKGASPLQKRLQTEVVLYPKEPVRNNLWQKLDDCTESNQSNTELGRRAINVKTENVYVEDRSLMKEYFMDTCLENSLPNAMLVERPESCGEPKRNCKESTIEDNEYELKKYAMNESVHGKRQFDSPVKSVPAMETNSSAQTPPSKALLNNSVDSIADNVELESLLDGVEWSPLVTFPDNQQIVGQRSMKTCKTLFPPGKNKEETELISKELETKCNLTRAQSYFRFLVLEVSRRELVDEQVVTKYGRRLSEKMLRLFDESVGQEKFCSLREEWEASEVEPGDIVHITGTFDSKTGLCILDNSADHYLVIHPDTLVSGTTVSMATKCLRQSVLNERFRTDDQSEVMLIGTLLHDLFDLAMEFHEFSPDALLERTHGLLNKLSYLDHLYSLGQTENWALEKVKEHIPLLCDWAKKFVAPFPHPDQGTMEFKTPEYQHVTEQPSVCISSLKDIEENIWSPRYGLKGKVDATVEVRIDRRPKIRRHRPDTRNLVQTTVLPLELKTGKMFTKLGSIEHRAQVILYTLLMSDRYTQAVDAGLLFYLKSSHMLSVPSFLHEKRALIMKRNEVARYLTLNRAGTTGTMPAMLKELNTCRRCPQAQNCTIFHKAVEQGDGVSSGLGPFFNETTDHVTNACAAFFTTWYKLVCLEGKEMEEKRNQREIWCLDGWEREKLGRCFSGMVLKSREDHVDSSGSRQYYRHRFERAEDHPSEIPLQEVPITVGERVILSDESKGAVALAAGYIHEVKKKEVVVLLDRDLTKRYDAQTEDTSSGVYRLDKDEEYSTLVTLWSNVAKLFKGDSDRDAQLRRQIIDLEPPVFSRKRTNDIVVMWSQTSEISEYFTQQSPSQNRSQTTLDPAKEAIIKELNSDQRKAVFKALCAHHYALILGMPGTGKTTTISCLVRLLVACGKSVLLTSYTHTAVDNILLKLKEANVDFLRLGQVHKVLPELQSHCSQMAAADIKTVDALSQLYESKSVVATTCLGVNHALFSHRMFDYCIVDEASQITQPVCIGPLRRSRVFILVGDHYQLPPLVQSVEAREGGMDVSLFKRLSEQHPHAVVSLEHQYRMNQDIMELSNTLIYENRLKCGTPDVAKAQLQLPNWDELVSFINDTTSSATDNWVLDALVPSRPVVFLNTDEVPAPETRSEHLVSNEIEASIVHQLACGLLRAGLEPSLLGIISPYRHQLKLISQVFHRETNTKHDEIEINTVDKYQGRDKSCIILSLVRSNEFCNVGDLLRDWRRVNVAVTRAKRKLILIGSLSTLKGSLLLQELFDLLEQRDWIQVLPRDAHKLCEFVGKSSQASPFKSTGTPRYAF